MPEPSTIHNTFVLERSYLVPPERVFAAFSDPVSKRRWFAEGGEGHETEGFEMDFQVGGKERASYRFKDGTPFPGIPLIADGYYLNIVPGLRVVIASTMTIGDRCISASLVTFEILPTAQGADLVMTHQGAFFEGSDGPQLREGGWRKLLDRFGTVLTS